MTEGRVGLTIEGSIAILKLDRAEKLNALTPEMIAGLAEGAARIDRDESVRCAILAAEGDKAFCVGADINRWAALAPIDMWRRWIRDGHAAFDGLARLRQPLIAAVNGMAFGGGLELALTADIRIAEEGALFALPETGIAAVPGWSGTQRLARLVGPSLAKEMIFTGMRISAGRAQEIGLVNKVVESGEGLAAAMDLAAGIARQAPISVQLAKQLVDAGGGEGLGPALEGMAGALAATTEDAREGIASFREKREASFKGK